MHKAIIALSMVLLMTTAACGKNSSVTGRWQDDASPRSMEFLSDGTVVLSSPGAEIANVAGKWTATSDGQFLLQFGSMAAYAHFEGEELVLEDRPIVHFHRVK
jgi:hypothetical protein